VSDLVSAQKTRRLPAHLVDYGSKGPAANNRSIKALRKEGLRLLADGTPYAAMRLLEAVDSDDDRVAIVAASQVLEHVRKMAESGGLDDDEPTELDVSRFSAEQRADAMECVRKLLAYLDLSRQLAAEVEQEGAATTGTPTPLTWCPSE